MQSRCDSFFKARNRHNIGHLPLTFLLLCCNAYHFHYHLTICILGFILLVYIVHVDNISGNTFLCKVGFLTYFLPPHEMLLKNFNSPCIKTKKSSALSITKRLLLPVSHNSVEYALST